MDSREDRLLSLSRILHFEFVSIALQNTAASGFCINFD
jgi:hypothetical protein